jgi:hypothetical protein
MNHRRYLVQNVAVWDRGIRFVVGMLCILGSPLLLSSAWWLTFVSAFGGTQVFTALTGY